MSYFEKVKVQGWNGTNWQDLSQDESTRALTMINHGHHEIHESSSYSIVDVIDLSVNNVRDLQITTPDTTKYAHFFFSMETESETDWYLYRDVTINTPGTAHVAYNNDHNGSDAATLGIKYIDNTSTANANADTAVAAAAQIYHDISGAGKDSGDHDHGHELILKRNALYCIRFIASSAGYVNYHLEWYEHTNEAA